MEEQTETSKSFTSTGGERGGGWGECSDVEEGADDNQRQLSPATIVDDEDL